MLVIVQFQKAVNSHMTIKHHSITSLYSHSWCTGGQEMEGVLAIQNLILLCSWDCPSPKNSLRLIPLNSQVSPLSYATFSGLPIGQC